MARRVASGRNVASSTRDMASSAWNMPLSARRMTSSAGGVASSGRIMALRRGFFLGSRSCRRINVKDILVGETLGPDRFVPAALGTAADEEGYAPFNVQIDGKILKTGMLDCINQLPPVQEIRQYHLLGI